jgi:hypothetical protein
MTMTRDLCLAQVHDHVKVSQKFAISQNYAKGSTFDVLCFLIKSNVKGRHSMK